MTLTASAHRRTDRAAPSYGGRHCAALAFALAVLATPVVSRADNAAQDAIPAKARTLADRGRAFHDAGEYDKAITAFTQAYVMAPSPALLFNLAQAYRLQGNCDDAALMYRRYIATTPSLEGRALAESHLANVERCMRKLSLHIPVETPNGRAVKPAPLSATAGLNQPSRAARIEQDIGVGLMGGGGVALAVAAYYALQAHNSSNEVAKAYEMGAKWKDVADVDQRGKAAATRAKIFGAGGAIGITGGLVMYLVGRHNEQPPVLVAPTSGGMEMSMSWSF